MSSFWGEPHFVVVIIWNIFSPWSMNGWANFFFINQLVIGGIVAVISTIWFSWGGTRDLIRLFRDLDKKEVNANDDGRVIDHVSADDVERVEKLDHVRLKEND